MSSMSTASVTTYITSDTCPTECVTEIDALKTKVTTLETASTTLTTTTGTLSTSLTSLTTSATATCNKVP